ncbi:MAG: polyketide cyclase, partial [Acidobacteriota bacterium]|nr:polyketide cyclase [Acidobacteriota bacterium]
MIIAQHTLETTALPGNIWALWTDVPGYKAWDEGIEWATLNGEFKVGANGQMKPREGRLAGFTISEVVEGRSFSILSPLPF